MQNQQMYRVWDERGGFKDLPAETEEQAFEVYWEMMESVLGHMEGCCACFKEPKRFPREKYLQPVRAERLP